MNSFKSFMNGFSPFPLPPEWPGGTRKWGAILWTGVLLLTLLLALGCQSRIVLREIEYIFTEERPNVVGQILSRGTSLSSTQGALKKEFGLPDGLLLLVGEEERREEVWIYTDLGWAFHFRWGNLIGAGPMMVKPASLPAGLLLAPLPLSQALSKGQLLRNLGQPASSQEEKGWTWVQWESWGAALFASDDRLFALQLGYRPNSRPTSPSELSRDFLNTVQALPNLPIERGQGSAKGGLAVALRAAKLQVFYRYLSTYATPGETEALLGEVDSWGPQGGSGLFLDRLETLLMKKFCGVPDKLTLFRWMRQDLVQEIYAFRFLATDIMLADQDAQLQEDVNRLDLELAKLWKKGTDESPFHSLIPHTHAPAKLREGEKVQSLMEWVPDCNPATKAPKVPSGFLKPLPSHDCPEEHRCLVIATQILNRFEQSPP